MSLALVIAAAAATIGQPDLRPIELRGPDPGATGMTLLLVTTVRNDGNVAAGPFVVELHYNDQFLFPQYDHPIGSFTVPGLAAGQSRQDYTQVTLPNVTAALSSYGVVVDSTGAVAESNEGNNRRDDDFFRTGARNVDYIVSACDVPPRMRPSVGTPMTFVSANVGGQDGDRADVAAWVRMSADQTINQSDTSLASFRVDRIDGGEERRRNLNITLPGSIPNGATRYIACWIDPDGGDYPFDGDEVESNEANNITVSPTVVTDVDLTGTLSAMMTAGPGLPLDLSGTVSNGGGQASPPYVVRLYESVDDAPGSMRTTLDELTRSALSAGGSSSFGPHTVTLPGTITGDGSQRVLLMGIDPGEQVPEFDESNNVSAIPYTVRTRDLLVDVFVGPVSASAGEMVELLIGVRNRGVEGSPAVMLAVSESSGPAGSANPIGTAQVPALAAGTSTLLSLIVTIPSHSGAPGTTRTLSAFVDSAGALAESHEHNNISTTNYTVQHTDLQVTQFSAPPVAGQGMTAAFGFMITNNGSTVVPLIEVALRQSSDMTIDGTDAELFRVTVGPILAGDTYAGTMPAVVLANFAGASNTVGYFGLEVDPDQSLAEADENNNTRSSIFIYQQRDLTLDSVSVSPSAVVAGGSVDVSYRVRNFGLDAGDGIRVKIFESADQALDFNDGQLADVMIGTVGSGGGAFRTTSVTIPGTLAPGIRYLFIAVDPDELISEFDETNNVALTSVSVGGNIDLVAVSLDAPATVYEGLAVNLSFAVRNDGDSAAGNVDIRFVLSDDVAIGPGDREIGQRVIAAIGPNSTVNDVFATGSLMVGAPVGAIRYIGMIVDRGGVIPETNEGNNTTADSVSVTGGDLVAVSLAGPANVSRGEQVWLQWSISNASATVPTPGFLARVVRSDDSLADELDDVLGETMVGGLAVASTATGSIAVTIPSDSIVTSVGNLLLVADAAFVISETDETNNVAGTPYTIVNRTPVARVVAPTAVDEGSQAVLDATSSTDPEGDPLTFVWRQLSGPMVTLSNTAPGRTTMTAPAVCRDRAVMFELEVCDAPHGDCDVAQVQLTIVQAVNEPPLIALSVQPGLSVGEEVRVTLDARGSSDCNGDDLTFEWTQIAGPAVPLSSTTTAAPTLDTPRVLTAIDLAYELSLCDGADCVSTAVTLRVLDDMNEAPEAVIASGAVVWERSGGTLDASASRDPNGDRLTSWRWGQASGPRMTVTGTATGSFFAPSVLETSTVAVTLVVVDDRGGVSLPATAQVIVMAYPDSDGDGLDDPQEGDLGTDPMLADTDGDGLDDGVEFANGIDPLDRDSDDDGVIDGAEAAPLDDTDLDGAIGALDPDSDNDQVLDGTEMRVATPDVDTSSAAMNFVPDADTSTGTDPLHPDTDGDGLDDGVEDANHNGRVDPGESDPNDPNDPPMVVDAGVTVDSGRGGPLDGSPRLDATPNPVLDSGVGDPPVEDGCGCAATRPTGQAGGVAIWIAVGLAALTRRKRRS